MPVKRPPGIHCNTRNTRLFREKKTAKEKTKRHLGSYTNFAFPCLRGKKTRIEMVHRPQQRSDDHYKRFCSAHLPELTFGESKLESDLKNMPQNAIYRCDFDTPPFL